MLIEQQNTGGLAMCLLPPVAVGALPRARFAHAPKPAVRLAAVARAGRGRMLTHGNNHQDDVHLRW